MVIAILTLFDRGSTLRMRFQNWISNMAAFVLAAMAIVGGPLDYAPGGASSAPLVLGGVAVLGTIAALGYTAWEADAHRARRVRLGAWTLIRYFLALEFTRYGVAKLVGMQFFQRFYLLDSRVVDMTSMNLAWSFFGHSYAYQAISGALEVLGAVLLCFRRTTPLGALVLFGVMSNVVLLNFCFDISVKLFSSIYLMMISYLLACEARRFWAFLVTNGPVPARHYLADAPPPWRTRLLHGFAVAAVIGLPALDILREAASHRLFTHEAVLGAWAIDSKVGLDDLTDVPGPWDKMYFEKGAYGFVRANDKRVRFTFEHDEATRRLKLTMGGPAAPPLIGAVDLVGRRASFVGTRGGRAFALELTRELPR